MTAEEIDQAVLDLIAMERDRGNHRRVAYLQAYRQGLTGRSGRVPGMEG